MNAASNAEEPPKKFKVPWDITEWIDRPSLLSCLIADIDSLDWHNPELLEFLRANPNFQPRFLLILISYAYSMGMCESDDVSELYFQDAELRKHLKGEPPGPGAITRFRREHRGLLKWAVVQVFKHALRSRFELGDATIPPGLMRAISDAAGIRIDVGRHLDRSVQVE